VDDEICSFGQVEAVRRREAGELFSTRDHLRGMVLAMLSANRPWKPIAKNLGRLEEIFGNYRPSFLESRSPEELERAVLAISCGNRRLRYQMMAVHENLAILRRIEARHGTLDAFVTAEPAERVAQHLGGSGQWKLRELGPTLVLEYLKNVGVRTVKPDVHIRRIAGPERLGILTPGADDATAAKQLVQFARAAGMHPVEFDNMLWMLGAEGYAEVCTTEPKCGTCKLRPICRFRSTFE